MLLTHDNVQFMQTLLKCILFNSQFIDVQPNDGFGTLLPQETLEIDLIFSPKTAKEYRFQLTCKSGINRLICQLSLGVNGVIYFDL